MSAPTLAQAASSGFGGSLLLIAVAIILWVLARMLLRVKGDMRQLRSEIATLAGLKSELAELRGLRDDLSALKELRAEVEALKSRPTASVPPPAPAAPQAPSPAPAPPKPADELTPEMFSAIIAAVAYTLGNTHEIVSISSADSLVWSREGRRNIFSSHSLR